MTPNRRLEMIADFVQSHLKRMAENYPSVEHNPVYRWDHTLRVAHYGKQIAKAEGADIEIVLAACMLHDVAHFECDDDYKSHGRIGAKIAREILATLDYTPTMINNICYSVAVHVDGEAGFEHPETLEALCVTDADNIDRFGAYRILQWCVPEMDEFPKLIDKLNQRIEKLRTYNHREKILETITGDRLFKRQLERQIAFYQALIDESKITTLPKLNDLYAG